jgi:hypothetical protein
MLSRIHDRDGIFEAARSPDATFGMMKRVAVAAVLLLLASCGDSPPPPDGVVTWRLLGSWRGHGNQQLETFPIQGGALRVHWETSNPSAAGEGRLEVRVHSGDSGRLIAEPVDARGVGRDTVNLVVEHHRIYLSVESANIDWSLRVDEPVTSRPPR